MASIRLKLLSAIAMFLIFLFTFTASSLAQETKTTTSSAQINTFELFWPITAGKTIDDKFYFLKDFKEKLRGALIFGDTEKANYAILLATKRVLEADKLISENKDFTKTLKLAEERVKEAQKLTENVRNKNQPLGQAGVEMNARLSNLEKFLMFRKEEKKDFEKEFRNLLDLVISTKEKLK